METESVFASKYATENETELQIYLFSYFIAQLHNSSFNSSNVLILLILSYKDQVMLLDN